MEGGLLLGLGDTMVGLALRNTA